MIVMKFGGSSVRDAERIRLVAEIVRNRIERRPILVFSALGDSTDNLIAAATRALDTGDVAIEDVISFHQKVSEELEVDGSLLDPLYRELETLLKGISLLRELSPRTNDYLLSFGERLSVRIISQFIDSHVHRARPFDAWELGLCTNSEFGEAEVLDKSYAAIGACLKPLKDEYSYIPIITGFVARDENEVITTLGRGGSDLTASVVGAAVQAEEVQVWKDVDGILSTDPRIVPQAQTVPGITFEEASELAYFGAKVLHPVSMQPAKMKNIPVRVKNSYRPEAEGTLITSKEASCGSLVKALTCKRNVTLIDIVSSRMLGQHGFLARVFGIFEKHSASVDMVATSEVSVSLTINNGSPLDGIRSELSEFANVVVGRDKAILSVIGDVARSSEILDICFSVLTGIGVNVQMISQGASKVNIGMIVEDCEVERCVRALHEQYFS